MHDARALAIMECAAEDMRVVEAAAHLGLTTATIYKYIRNYNISFSRDLTKLVRENAGMGLTRGETAKKLGICYSVVCQIARDENIDFFRVYTHQEDIGEEYQKRADIMAALYRNGYTLVQIGEQYGITRERVRQIIAKVHGMNRFSGGQHAKAEKTAAKKQSKKDAACYKRYGCSHSEWRGLLELGEVMVSEGKSSNTTPTGAYRMQKKNAAARGIPFHLTVTQWWDIWQTSGKWDERGRGQGYVMCRRGDEGPYAVGNVYIDTAAHNSSDAPKKKKSSLPTGVKKLSRGNYLAYAAYRNINGERLSLGTFKTPELAHAAYLMAGAA